MECLKTPSMPQPFGPLPFLITTLKALERLLKLEIGTAFMLAFKVALPPTFRITAYLTSVEKITQLLVTTILKLRPIGKQESSVSLAMQFVAQICRTKLAFTIQAVEIIITC